MPETPAAATATAASTATASNRTLTKLSLSVACPKNLKINPRVQVKELIDSKSGDHYFRITIPRELVKDILGSGSKVVKQKARPIVVAPPVSSLSSSEAGEEDSMRHHRHS